MLNIILFHLWSQSAPGIKAGADWLLSVNLAIHRYVVRQVDQVSDTLQNLSEMERSYEIDTEYKVNDAISESTQLKDIESQIMFIVPIFFFRIPGSIYLC